MAEQVTRNSVRSRNGSAVKVAGRTTVRSLWILRLVAIKTVGSSQVLVHAVVTFTALGLAAAFSIRALLRADWPPMNGSLLRFIFVTGRAGF